MNTTKPKLGLFDTVMLVSGSMIGSGIFIVSADMTRTLGSPFWVLVCWLLSGVITLFAALSYGELAAMMPGSGGQFIYLKRAFGPLTGFIYGWTVFTVIQTGVIAAVAVAFSKYMGLLFPFFDERHLVYSGYVNISRAQLLGVGLIVFLSWVNSRGINSGRIIQGIFTSAKITALVLLIIAGIIFGYSTGYFQHNIQLPFVNGLEGTGGSTTTIALMAALGVASIGSLFSSDAWNNVTFVAGEIRNPQRNLPLGLFLGVFIVTILYILSNVAYFMLLPADQVAHAPNDRVGSAALQPLLGNTSAAIMAALIVVSTFGCNNGLILSGARLYHAMSFDGLFIKSASYVNERNVPSTALWQQCIWSSVLCLSGSYGALLDYCTFASLLFYVVTVCALFRLRKTEPLAGRPYKTIGYPLVPALYILLAGGICLDLIIMKPLQSGLGLAIMATGVPVYFFLQKKKHGNTMA